MCDTVAEFKKAFKTKNVFLNFLLFNEIEFYLNKFGNSITVVFGQVIFTFY